MSASAEHGEHIASFDEVSHARCYFSSSPAGQSLGQGFYEDRSNTWLCILLQMAVFPAWKICTCQCAAVILFIRAIYAAPPRFYVCVVANQMQVKSPARVEQNSTVLRRGFCHHSERTVPSGESFLTTVLGPLPHARGRVTSWC